MAAQAISSIIRGDTSHLQTGARLAPALNPSQKGKQGTQSLPDYSSLQWPLSAFFHTLLPGTGVSEKREPRSRPASKAI